MYEFTFRGIVTRLGPRGSKVSGLQGSPEAPQFAHETQTQEDACMHEHKIFNLHFATCEEHLHSHSRSSSPWPWALAPPPRSSRSSRASCCAHFRSRTPTGLFCWEIIWEAGQACPLGLVKSKRTHLRPGRFPLWAAISRHRLSFQEALSQNKSMPHASIPKCFRRSAFGPSSAVSLPRKKTMPVNRSP